MFAQPANDDCPGVINLGVAPVCPQQFFTNVGATASNIGAGNNPTCFNGGIAPRDVWFAFTTSDTITDYTITVAGGPDGGSPGMRNPQIALYRGDCQFNGLAELTCASAPSGETRLQMDVYGLTPNVVYYMRISDYSPTATPNSGTFQVCVEQLQPVFTIDEGGSTACFGQLFDSGGPDGDYSNNENHTFTICPTDFHQCIIFTLEYYNIEGSDFFSDDQILFYDAATPAPSALIASIGGSALPSDGGGGGVCYTVQASSGCLTVQFRSDATVVQEGFAGRWQCTSAPCQIQQPITVQGNITEQDILNSITSVQTNVTITNINCPPTAYGTFRAPDNSELGLSKGLLLTTGQLTWAVGPNNNTGGGNIIEANNNAPGDPDLDYLSVTFGDGTESNDACIIELDITAFTNEITFEYIFASEEYPEFVNEFNDIFAFLISGPGIVGDPNIGNQRNIAVLPDGSNTIIEINNVNHLNNWQYYRNNENGRATQYDGLTSDLLGIKKSLTARASVTPCSTYHLKIAIADRLDFVYDSGIFLSEIRGGAPRLAMQYNSGVDYLIERCTSVPDNLLVQLSNVLDEPASYRVQISGTATRDVDYVLNIPDTVVFQPGETQLAFPITVLSDALTEGIETIIITLTNNFGCGEVTYTSITVELRDELAIRILPDQDTALVCVGGSAQLSVEGAATYFWTPVNIISDPISPSTTATPAADTWVRVEGTVGICTALDSIFLKIIDPVISISALDPVAICQGDSVRLQVTDNTGNANLSWSPTAGLSDAQSPSPVAAPQVTTTYVAAVRLFACTVSDSITIDVNPFEFPVLNNDTTVCQNYSVRLAEQLVPEATVYSWTPVIGLDDPTLSGPLATPDVTTTYTLIATSTNGACADTARITITVLPADVDIQQPDTLEICLGTAVPLTAVTSTGSAQNLRWSTNLPGSLSDTTGLSVVAEPPYSATYYTTFVVGACTVFDSVYIRVDSLPVSDIVADPFKNPYCPGEIVILSSETYEPSDFPDIRFVWLPAPGFETPDTLWNMVISTVDTATYRRVITNRACVDTAFITLNVVEPPDVVLTPADTLICPGQSVQLLASGYGEYSFRWEPENGLSCTDCPNPVVTPTQDVTYTFVAEVPNCPVGASATIRVQPPPTLAPISSRAICLGTAVRLNNAFDPFTTYRWTSSTDPNFQSDDPLLTVAPLVTTTYTLTATRGTCPPVVANITLTVVLPPTAAAGPDQTICMGTAANLSGTTGGSASTGTWTATPNTGAFSPNANTLNATFTPAQPGTYVLLLTATDPANVCTTAATDELVLTVNPKAEVNAGPDTTICAGESIRLQGTIGGSATSAVWSAAVPGGTFNPNANTLNAVYTPPAGITSVALTLLTNDPDGPCPFAADTMVITIIPPATVDAGPDVTVCRGSPLTLTATGTAAANVPQGYSWTSSVLAQPQDGQTLNINNTNPLPAQVNFVVTYRYGPGLRCGAIQDTVRVTIADPIIIDSLNAAPREVFAGQEVTISVVTTPAAPADAMYIWREAGSRDSIMGGPTFTVRPAPTFGPGQESVTVTYEVVVKSAAGCLTTQRVDVLVRKPFLDFPNVFTPNGDGKNDVFLPVPGEALIGVDILDFKVYNRWGQVVYDGRKNNNEGWDGTHNGSPAPADVYVYRVRYRIPGQEVQDAKGDLTLIR